MIKVYISGNYNNDLIYNLKEFFYKSEELLNVKFYGKKEFEYVYIVVNVSSKDYMLIEDDLISYFNDLRVDGLISNFRVDME